MKAELKALLSPDIEDFSTYRPENPAAFGFPLQLLVGPAGEEGMESFQLTVCTPQWLMKTYQPHEIIIGRHYLIVFEYDYSRLIDRISGYISQCTGENWHEVAEKVARLGYWEFEDYQHR